MRTLVPVISLLLVLPDHYFAAEPLPVIFDTDSDCDDAGALAMLHALADRGEVRILATPVSARHRWSGPCVDAINTYFGRPDLPIGIPRTTPNRQGSRFAEAIARQFAHDFPANGQQPDAVAVYRRVLAAQPDGSVTLITVGDLTNIRDLLASKADPLSPLDGVELTRAKVQHWFCMGSRYPADLDPARWGNFKMDPQATREAIRRWPRPITFTGGGNRNTDAAHAAGPFALKPAWQTRRGCRRCNENKLSAPRTAWPLKCYRSST